MITEKDLREAIAECHGTRNPNANTCIKLAAYYTILNSLYGNQIAPAASNNYSYAAAADDVIKYSDSEFSQCVEKIGIEKAFPIIDEIMNTLSVINPKLYRCAIGKLS